MQKKVICHFKVGTYDLVILLFVRKNNFRIGNGYLILYKIILLQLYTCIIYSGFEYYEKTNSGKIFKGF